jgi:hypothetical protein
MTKPKRVFGECVYAGPVQHVCEGRYDWLWCEWTANHIHPPGMAMRRSVCASDCARCPCFEKREEKK